MVLGWSTEEAPLREAGAWCLEDLRLDDLANLPLLRLVSLTDFALAAEMAG